MSLLKHATGIILTCVVSTSAMANTDILNKLRNALEQSLSAKEEVQYVTFGPMHDGRTIELDIRFHNDGGVPSVRPSSKEGIYQIDFPRHRIVKLPFIGDASMGCSMNVDVCSLMSDYISTVQQASSPLETPFFDEAYPEYKATFTKLRQQDFWLPAINGGIQSAIVVVDAHEICHIALDHLNSTKRLNPLQLEGQADGCMLHLLSVSDFTPVGGLAYMADALFNEEVLGEFSYTHPSPICRSLALSEATITWLGANRQSLSNQHSTANMPSQEALENSFSLQSRRLKDKCSEYNHEVETGKDFAAQLFDETTNLISDP